ncbi:uncharacterized protein ACHE_61010A [Aspergillus chevalieri]|uniref:Uncharacterized protein n=1 Tax=Aspergillus chevalieri TaxID=182096 RepID=A0A7R7VUP2_ASPCH|nr:uncharacterized protein ACHE_61010A [Aspergillus chevalieri]BCR91124.1 hypothetical protein ACHE_61010A [Aspergillus chevalieri]
MNVQVLRGQQKTIVRVDKEGRERKKLESCRFEPPAAAARHMSPQSPSPEQDNNIQFTTCTLCSLYFIPLQSPPSLFAALLSLLLSLIESPLRLRHILSLRLRDLLPA